jgi:FMN reductase
MHNIITISGSPSPVSRTSAILNYAKECVLKKNIDVESISVGDLPPEDLVYGNFKSPNLKKLQILLEQAHGIIICTPVYQSSYTGVLKALLDLMPQSGFAGKTVLPIAIGGTSNHLLSIDYAMKPLLAAMGATHILKGVYIVTSQIEFDEKGQIQLDSEIEERLLISLQELAEALKHKQTHIYK